MGWKLVYLSQFFVSFFIFVFIFFIFFYMYILYCVDIAFFVELKL